MNLDFSDILLEVVRQKASDLHITSGAAPMLRVRGSLVAIEGMPRLTPTDTREIVYAILNSSQRQKLETDWQIDFAYSIPGHARFRVNAYFQRGTIGAAFRLIPAETVRLRSRARCGRSSPSACRAWLPRRWCRPLTAAAARWRRRSSCRPRASAT